ncbi:MULTISPECIES: hypothetical protein [unclassified Mycobacterium]|uniref:hypothetical protein n=1 Tax=unclassified Mycobacterium TaxID=2642494 RepID=UPI0029C97A1E|nr:MULTISPECIES: hypothetical protein [unclassified Mycobacterium]
MSAPAHWYPSREQTPVPPVACAHPRIGVKPLYANKKLQPRTARIALLLICHPVRTRRYRARNERLVTAAELAQLAMTEGRRAGRQY